MGTSLDPEGTRYADMLYNHQNDHEENHNISVDPHFADMVDEFREINQKNRLQAETVDR